ncbi:hypothetical protein COCNU_10G000040 [Cocos nucifera]|uniref:Uncharacterized protein n=1 Tax=Cocos nucifera TaxID=13894 RepID=A0A8K0IKM6_COCNU|nr:hypothetical protein COCNU_10G000040 [Cocos nucifera]
MSSRMVDALPEASIPTEVPPEVEFRDSRSGLGDYRVARFLIQSTLLPADMETMDHEGGAFQVWNSYDFLLWEAEEKANQANRRADDAELSKLKAEELKRETRRLKSKLSKVRSNFEARLEVEKKKYEGELEAFKTGIDLKEKLKKILLDFNLELLESDNDEEANEGRDGKIRMEDLFNPALEDQMVEQGASAKPPAIIILSDHAEVSESRALNEA